MSDTVKIERPMACRRRQDRGGRMKKDSLGNALTVKTRAHDSPEPFGTEWLDDTSKFTKGPSGF